MTESLPMSPILEQCTDALLAALLAYDPTTHAHSIRVGKAAGRVAEELGLPGGTVRLVRRAGALHDVGKIAMPRELLTKSDALDDSDWAAIRCHPGAGAGMLVALSPDFGPIADVVRAHHERLDGAGYPVGLAGEQIPLAARVVTAVDVYDAVTSARGYRSHAMSSEEALDYLAERAGSHFDPDCVAAVVAVVRRRPLRHRLRSRSAA